MRRVGVEKIGYYPIPPEMMSWIAARLDIEAGAAISFVDPCMGEGAALKVLLDNFKAKNAKSVMYGCEISQVRYEKAVQLLLNERREGISRLLHGPAEFIDLFYSSFSLLYLNPPFDDHGQEQDRWLELTGDWLTADGLLVFITTEASALQMNTQKILHRYYDHVTCYCYPDQHRQFNEVVVFARRRKAMKHDELRLPLYKEDKLTTLTLDEQFTLKLPEAHGPQRFKMTIPDLETSLPLLHKSGISQGEDWNRLTQVASLSGRWQPLLDLSDGHIANLISSGAFDGMPIDDPDLGRCLISGYGTKEKSKPVIEVDDDGITDKETVTEFAVVHLVAMNIDTGEIHRFNSLDVARMEAFIVRHLDTLKKGIADTLKPMFDVNTMLDDYLPYVPYFKAPGILPGATRLRLTSGEKVRALKKLGPDYLAVTDSGEQKQVLGKDVAHIYQNMLPAQVIKAAAMAYGLEHQTTSVIEVGQMGCGKTSTSMLTLYLYLAKRIEKAMQPVKEHLQRLGELESDLLETAPDLTGRIQYLRQQIRETEKVIQAKFKIVVVCPGHLVNKWAREATANFSEMRFNGEKARIVIPGRVPHRVIHYRLLGGKVACDECGTAADVKLTSKDILKGITLKDKLLRLGRLKCNNKHCTNWLIQTYDDCAVQDIDDAFAAPGLTILILSKEDAKLGASWQTAFYERTVRVRDENTGEQVIVKRVKCPECGTVAQDRHGYYLRPEDLRNADKRVKHYCLGTVERPKRENGKTVMEKKVFYEWRGTKYQAAHLPEGITPHQLVRVEREVPVMEKRLCGAPLFGFTRLESRRSAALHNTFGQWVSGEAVPNHGSARWELAKVIARRHRNEYMLIIDETHMFKAADSTQGKAIQWLIQSATETIALTGTIFGGKASSLFYLLYRLSPQFREAFNWDSKERFVDLYGVHTYITKKTRVNEDGEPSAFGAHLRTTERSDEGNGVDPSIIRWLLSIGVFLTLEDLGITLPNKEERFHWLAPEPELSAGLRRLDAIRDEAAALAAQGDFSMFSAWMQAALGWPLCPDQDEVYLAPAYRRKMESLLKEGKREDAEAYQQKHTEIWAEAVPFTPERPESLIVSSIADACLTDWQAGDKSVVYIAGIKRPANKHLYAAMKRRGLKPFLLATPGDTEVGKWCDKADFARCELEDREAVIAEALAEKDINVLIVNPPLVATGLDLISFNHLHFETVKGFV